MWNWHSSNPPRISERPRRPTAALVASLLLAAMPVAAQPLRQVLVELRIEPGSTLDQARLRAPEVVAAAEAELVRIAHDKFLFLEWLASRQTAAPDAPRWSLQLADGPEGACDPPSVRARFHAERGGVIAWTYPELEFSELCDLGAPELTTAQFVARVGALGAVVIGDADAMAALEERFLSEVVLSKALEPDLATQRLYLPLKGLKAKAESEIEVRFENRVDSRLFAHPGNVEGGRTQLLLDRFACAGIDSGAPAANAFPVPWHPRLQELLDTCQDPWFYMKAYKPNPLEVESGVVRTFDEGGNP